MRSPVRCWLFLVAALFVRPDHTRATTYNITTVSGFASLPATLSAGDEVVIQDGTYAAVNRTLNATGTAQSSVTVHAAHAGRAVFTGSTQFVLHGSHLIVTGLSFDGNVAPGAPKYSSGIFRLDTGSSDCTLRDCLFRNFDSAAPTSAASWVQISGYHHTVEYCSFVGKFSPNPIINIVPNEDDDAGNLASKDISRQHLIRFCYFADRTNIGDNGYETIRLGESQYQMYDLSAAVEYNLFERAIYGDDVNGYEPEVISSKSRNNVYRYNTFRQNKGGLVLRHGDDCVVEGNFFFGEAGSTMGAGVRIIGQRHIVRNNYLENIGGSSLRAAVCVMKGSGAFPDDSTNNGYESPNGARIFHNTLIHCTQPFELGATTSSSGTTAPTGVEIRNNAVQSVGGDGAVIDFNAANGWTISQVAFSGNFAYHPSGMYGTVPASGFNTGTPLQLSTDPTLGYSVPASGSPLLDAAAATVPATLADVRSAARAAPHDAGCFDLAATGGSFNRPLLKADVGPVFDGRANADRVPFVVLPPAAQTVLENDPASFAVTVESALPVTYQWRRNDLPIAGATAAIYTIPRAAAADAGVYSVAVTNSAGRTLGFGATLVVTPAAPTISGQPAPQLVTTGGTANLDVTASGVGPFTYQWRKDGVAIAGATAARLTVSPARLADAGGYSVAVSNGHGSIMSNAARLTVIAGAILLNDDFSDGERLTQSLPASAAWYSSSGTLSVTGGALAVPAGRHALAFFRNSGVETLAAGERLSVALTVRFSSVGTASGGFRLGLFNSNGTPRPADGTNASFSGYDGYVVTTTAAYPDNNGNPGGPLVVRQRNPGVAATLLSTIGGGIYSDVASSPATAQGFVAGVDYRFSLTVQRTAAGNVNVALSAEGGTLASYAFDADDTGGLVTAFDSFAVLSTSTNGSAFSIDNVQVAHQFAPLAAWRQDRFGTPVNAGDASDGADPDQDGLCNLLEYALGRDPRSPDATGATRVAVEKVGGNDYLTLTFTRDLTAAGATLAVQAGSTLGAWENIDPDGANRVRSTVTGTLQTLTVRDNVPVQGNALRFMRLAASVP